MPNHDLSGLPSGKFSAESQPAAPQTILVNVDRFGGSELVDGLRIARMPPGDTFAVITAFGARDYVLYAEPNYITHDDITPNDPRFLSNELYGLNSIGAPAT